MSCTQCSTCTCGCCSGTAIVTPMIPTNLPGQSTIQYRVGTWSAFKESMMARLSSSDYPALAPLRTRDDDDFTIAFLDASSVIFDILTFYQERLANESYLRTAGQLRSLIELSRLIGYQPSPGVSASVYLAYTLKATPGYPPNPANPAITIPAGTQVQSVPAQGQHPQTFETAADILAKSDWNALPVQTGVPWSPSTGDTRVYLDGTGTQLQPGDPILVVGDERKGTSTAPQWDIRIVIRVETDTGNSRTRIYWNEGLGSPDGSVAPSSANPKIYALRQRTALFGYNALDPNSLEPATAANMAAIKVLTASGTPPSYQWANFVQGTTIDLDNSYPKIVQGGWLALVLPDSYDPTRSLSGFVNLYQVASVSPVTRTSFGLSGKITRVAPDTTASLSSYKLRDSFALAQSELLPTTIQPFSYPLYGSLIDLEDLRPDLVTASVVAIFGKAQKLTVADGVNSLNFIPDDNTAATALKPGDTLTLTSPTPLPLVDNVIPDWTTATVSPNLSVLDSHGRPGSVQSLLSNFTLATSNKHDPLISEYCIVVAVNQVLTPYPHTQIALKDDLHYCYERATATVNANVALATHGSSVTEFLGSGSAATPNQSFALKQAPLTFVAASTPSGGQSTLQITASGVKWTEVPSLYEQSPTGRVFATLNQPGGKTTVLGGDNTEGATFPTGQNNLQATYRVGIGAAGNVAAGTITSLMDRPLGVSGVINPEAASGGQDAATVDDLRSDAPQTVLTLGRAVSIMDYQNYASSFSGIAKAYAIWIPSGHGRGVFLTVAGVGGAALPNGNPTAAKLFQSLQNYGSPLVPITLASFLETLFGLSADIAYDPAYDATVVEAAVRQTLASTYSFANRALGQGVSLDEIAALIQSVPGVIAVNVKAIYVVATSTAGDLASQPGSLTVTKINAWLAQQVTLIRPYSDSPDRICAYLPKASLTATPQPAELLVLDPDPTQVQLGVMA
ncbi:MAG TPA: putative baseplate assembly protein [Acidisarcina sp.]